MTPSGAGGGRARLGGRGRAWALRGLALTAGFAAGVGGTLVLSPTTSIAVAPANEALPAPILPSAGGAPPIAVADGYDARARQRIEAGMTRIRAAKMVRAEAHVAGQEARRDARLAAEVQAEAERRAEEARLVHARVLDILARLDGRPTPADEARLAAELMSAGTLGPADLAAIRERIDPRVPLEHFTTTMLLAGPLGWDRSRETTDFLLRLLDESPARQIRQFVARALQPDRGGHLREELLDRLEREVDQEVVWPLAQALANFTQTPETRARIRRLADAERWDHRVGATWLLDPADTVDRRILTRMATNATDGTPESASSRNSAIERLASERPPHQETVDLIAGTLIGDPQTEVRKAVASALGEWLKDVPDLKAAVIAKLRSLADTDPDLEVRIVAADALGEWERITR